MNYGLWIEFGLICLEQNGYGLDLELELELEPAPLHTAIWIMKTTSLLLNGRSSTLSSIISSCESDCESISSSLCSSTNENPIEDVRTPNHIIPHSSTKSELNHRNPILGDLSCTLVSESEYNKYIIPPHKTVEKGLTFQEICRNKHCKLFNKKFVNFHLGMCT